MVYFFILLLTVIKKGLKYLFLSAVVIFALFQSHDSHGINHINQKNSYRLTKHCHDVFRSSSSELNTNRSGINMILKELNFEELNFQKFKLLKNINFPSFFDFHSAVLVESAQKIAVPSYTYAESAFHCWYILYQVFRI